MTKTIQTVIREKTKEAKSNPKVLELLKDLKTEDSKSMKRSIRKRLRVLGYFISKNRDKTSKTKSISSSLVSNHLTKSLDKLDKSTSKSRRIDRDKAIATVVKRTVKRKK
tara:strand:+ start:286 stop:615 length:330 start_codon:yes stop_codon:yes gene_type:complete